MTSSSTLGIRGMAVLALICLPLSTSAHVPHRCPEGFPDTPALPGHLEQADIVSGRLRFQDIVAAGARLFTTAFNICDGQGRPAATGAETPTKRVPDQPAFIRTSAPDSNSCAGCHHQPRAGGSRDVVANVFVLAQTLDPVTESVSTQFSDERHTLGMFGAGPIEMLAREMTADLWTLRAAALQEARAQGTAITTSLDTKGVHFGQLTAFPDGSVETAAVEGVDADLIIKPFHQAGVVRSLREFTVNAFNHPHGMQAEERFDLSPATGLDPDFDEDGVARELTIGDVTAATVFQAALGTPGRRLPTDPRQRQAVDGGETLFAQIGCTSCHVPELPLQSRLFVEPYALNPPGTFNDTSQAFAFDMTEEGEKPRLEKATRGGASVRAYTDLKRHDLCDDPRDPMAIRVFGNEQLAQGRPVQDGRPGAEFFITRKLWAVGNSPPYGHQGTLTTLTEAILDHGGEARASRDAFVALSSEEQGRIVQFLKTLQVLPPGSPPVIIEP
jgi:Di-haem oxidoreductase, putative peroxidase